MYRNNTVDNKKQEKTGKARLPLWSWIFAAACAAIPVVTRGGAFPVGLAAFGILGCLGTAMQTQRKRYVNIIICTVLAAMLWAVLWVLSAAMMAAGSM